MKISLRVFAPIIAVVLTVGNIVGCGPKGPSEEEIKAQKTQEAFDKSKAAYDNVNAAYEIVEAFGDDIYNAWRMGIYDKDELLDGKTSISHFASETSLSEDEVRDGIVYTIADLSTDTDWDTIDEGKKQELKELANYSFTLFEDDLFSFCTTVVSNAYRANGKVEEASKYLEDAKGQMKDLSANFSDYEHYPALKGYYTTTSSFFDFCQNPTGSFEQLKSTVDDYRNKARDYNADLDYIFED